MSFRSFRWGGGALVAVLAVVPWATSGAVESGAGDDLFTNTAIRHIRIEIAKTNMAILRAPVSRRRNTSNRPSVPATVREGSSVWTNVAVHLKGSLGSFRPVDDKPGLTLNFDKLAEHQRFHGLQKISLNNSVQDPSFVSEKICRDLFRAADVPVPRVDYATVELNGRKLGLYVLAEGWNKQFLRRYFKNAKGNFYDPGGGRDVNSAGEPEFGESPGENVAVKAAADAMEEADDAVRLKRLRETVDLDRLLSMHAIDVLIWNWDGYGMGRNNYRFFDDLDKKRLVIMPHGLDQVFWKPDGPIVTGRAGLIVKALLSTREGRELYLERFRQLRDGVFNDRAITDQIAKLSARLQPALGDRGARVQQQFAAARLSALVVARAHEVDLQLASVKNFVPFEINAAVPLTNWTMMTKNGSAQLSQVTDPVAALRLNAKSKVSLACWGTTLWLEEGHYRIEGRVKTQSIRADGGGGAGFRVWSTRKDRAGTSWDWFPYHNGGDERVAGLLPAASRTGPQRVTGTAAWTPITYEFELRQPLADLQIQCVLQSCSGEAWFDLSSLKIRCVALKVSKTTTKSD